MIQNQIILVVLKYKKINLGNSLVFCSSKLNFILEIIVNDIYLPVKNKKNSNENYENDNR